MPRTLSVLLLVAAVLCFGQEVGEPNPHAFMDEESRCGGCHHVEPDGDDWILDPHLFVVPVVDACMACHPSEQIGRSHPVNVDPYATIGLRDAPEALPLHWSDDLRTEVMTCGTCHNPHLPRLSEERLFTRQRARPGHGGRYLTYFLRLRGATPKDGFTPLCHACHPDL